MKQSVLITGGASGIGLALTKAFASKQYKVYFLDFNKESGMELQAALVDLNQEVQFIHGNVADREQMQDIINKIGPLDILINNAGISHVGNLGTTQEEDFDRLFQVNVKGVFNCSQAAISKMKEQGKGLILNMCSVAASMGLPDRFAYSMTKGAVLSMTLSIARDYVEYGIRCNCISPGRVHTPFVDGFLSKNYPGKEKEMFDKLAASQPIGRMGKPEEIAALALYLSSPEASFITGTNFPIDGGFLGLKM
ncbi:SDR family NAD(P)-dependent oxidoreductase [Pararhodonellum marinum]|uniref:SDR family NAD(P)-dependent oxidoreductase n=1 Tax=Pararhodonellum marinum TaxID=2755358 RepID=UPI00188EB200|nr:SDR family oxidoreductase [Pararhodonellum marinum]